jgi:molybdopterin synthase catalytic subunit
MTASVRLTARPLSVAAAWRALQGEGAGGVVLFAGRVRPDRSAAGRVEAILYESHRAPALAVFRTLAATAERRFGATALVLWHRTGRVAVGEVSVIVGATCGHRAEAFRAARYLIDRLKVTVPIWKTERSRPAHRPRRSPARRGGRSSD